MNLAKAIVESMPKPQDTIKPRWATVTSASPLRIRFDGEDNPLNLTPVDLVGVSLNDRVWCQLYAGQVFIIGINGGKSVIIGISGGKSVIDDSGWLDLTSADGTASVFAYRRLNGVVYLKAVINHDWVHSTYAIATIPAGFRPSSDTAVSISNTPNVGFSATGVVRSTGVINLFPNASHNGNLFISGSWPV